MMVNLENFDNERNNFFYKDEKGKIYKYKKYCIQENCFKISSYNYGDRKNYLYCKDHKLRNMLNIKKTHILCKKHDISH